MIVEDEILNEWEIYSAKQFEEEFRLEEKWDEEEPDEDYIMRHLEADKRRFKVFFKEDPRNNAYEEYWLIQEVDKMI